MKKFLPIILFLFVFIGNAEAGRNGIQMGSSGNINLIHYGDDYAWAAGLSLGYDEVDVEVEKGNVDVNGDAELWEIGVFARKNFLIQEKTYAALGVWGQWGWGQAEIEGYEIADMDRFSISPYFLVEHHLTDHLFLSAGAEMVRFTNTDYEVGAYEIEVDETSIFEPFISLAYVF